MLNPLGFFFKMGQKMKPCDHRPFQQEYRNDRLYCLVCKRDVADEHGSGGLEVGAVAMIRHDPYEYPAEQGVWYKGRCGITPGEARTIQRQNAALSENARESKQGGRLRARIPAALFWAHQKKDPGYWHDKKNLNRVAKEWGVSPK